MKRILSLFIVACLCGSLLVGCGKTEAPVMTVPLMEQELLVPSESESELQQDDNTALETELVVSKPVKGAVSPAERLSREQQELTKEIIAKAWQAVRQEEWIVETSVSESTLMHGDDAGTVSYGQTVTIFNTVTGEFQKWNTMKKDEPIFNEQDITQEQYIVLEDGRYVSYFRVLGDGSWFSTNRVGYGGVSRPIWCMQDWQPSLVYLGDIQEVDGYSCYVLSSITDDYGTMGYVYIDTETFLVRLSKEVYLHGEKMYNYCDTTTYEYADPAHEIPAWTKDAIFEYEPFDEQSFEGFFTDTEEIGTEFWRGDNLDSERVLFGPVDLRPSKSAAVIFEEREGYVAQTLLTDIYIVNSQNLAFEAKGVDKEFLLSPNQFAVCLIRDDEYVYDLFLYNPSLLPVAIKDCVVFAAAWTGGYVSHVSEAYLPYLSFDVLFGISEHQSISDDVFTSRWEGDEYIAWTVSEYPNILVLQDKDGPDLLKIAIEGVFV